MGQRPIKRNSHKSHAACAALLLWSAAAFAAGPQVVDRIVAVIDDEIITLRELEARGASFLKEVESIEDPQERARRRAETIRKILDIEIGERIVDRELAESTEMLGVTDRDIDRAIAEVTRMNNMNREQLQAALYGQGMTWTDYRTKLKSQIERARLIQMKVQGNVRVNADDVVRLCEERQKVGKAEALVCASHILLKVQEGASDSEVGAARAKASQLQIELSSGADFAAYAMKHSDDKGTPDGALGCFGRGEMVPEFEKVAFQTAPGSVSSVVRTPFGFHIIKVTGTQLPATAGCVTDEELAPFRNEVYQRAMEQQMNLWIEDLRKKSFVDVRL